MDLNSGDIQHYQHLSPDLTGNSEDASEYQTSSYGGAPMGTQDSQTAEHLKPAPKGTHYEQTSKKGAKIVGHATDDESHDVYNIVKDDPVKPAQSAQESAADNSAASTSSDSQSAPSDTTSTPVPKHKRQVIGSVFDDDAVTNSQ